MEKLKSKLKELAPSFVAWCKERIPSTDIASLLRGDDELLMAVVRAFAEENNVTVYRGTDAYTVCTIRTSEIPEALNNNILIFDAIGIISTPTSLEVALIDALRYIKFVQDELN